MPQPNSEILDANVDQVEQSTTADSVVDDVDEKAQGGGENHGKSIQELNDRIDGLERRLWQTGLLKESEHQTQSIAAAQEANASETAEPNKDPNVANLRSTTHSPSSRNKMGERRDSSRFKAPLKTENGIEESIQSLADRVDILEKKRLGESGQLEESVHLEDITVVVEPRVPAIPKLHYVEWSEFKNKLAGDEKIYAIEVLVGGAKYYHQRSEEERKNKQRLKDHSNSRDQSVTDHKKSKSLPERIRINSKPVILILNQIDPRDRSEYPPVMLRPFKALIYHESRIREVFQKLETKWRSADVESPIIQALGPSVTSNTGDNTIPTVLDEVINSIAAENDAPGKAEVTPDHTYPPSTSKEPQKSLPIEQSGIVETEKHLSEEVDAAKSKDTQDEENEDLIDSLEALSDLRCLIEFIDAELKPVVDSYRDMSRQKVAFCDLWHIYKPGDLLHSPLGNKQTSEKIYHRSTESLEKPNDRFQEVWRIASTTGGRPHLEESEQNFSSSGPQSRINAFLICAYWIDFDGTRFLSRTFLFWMIPFSGEKDITSLQCYPLRYAAKPDEMKSKWKARGEVFREYMTFKYRYYTGKTLTCSPSGFRGPDDNYPRHSENIDSQVVVDFGEALAANPGWRTSGRKLTLQPEDAPGELSEDYPTSFWKDSHRKVLDEECDDELYEDEHIDSKLLEDYIECDPLLRDHPQTSPAANGDFDENHLILLPNRVFAFVMKNRKWGE